MPPCLHSIASSLKAHPDEVHLTVGVTHCNTNGHQRKGVCSSCLADCIDAENAANVFVSPQENFKTLDDPEASLIMAGAAIIAPRFVLIL